MKKDIIVKDEKRGVVQITTLDERWYAFQGMNGAGIPSYDFLPSITWIGNYYPKGVGYARWLAEHGWDEAERIKMEAGDRGTIVHHACEKYVATGIVRMDEKFSDRDGNERGMTPDEYYCVITFSQWYESVGRPPLLKVGNDLYVEKTVRGDGYAGTLDFVFVIDGKNHLRDLKTSKEIWPSHEIQGTALKAALEKNGIPIETIGVIQVGYTRNKNLHYKETTFEFQPEILEATKKIWAKENPNTKPFQRDYPLSVSFNTTPEAQKGTASESESPKGTKLSKVQK